MRIIQVIDIGWPAGGAEISVMILRDQLVAQGHEVRVLSTDLASDGRQMFADVVVPSIAGGALGRFVHKLFHPPSYRAMRDLLDKFCPDVVHVHTVGELSPSVLWALRDVPYVLTLHGPEDFLLRLLPWHLPAADYADSSYRWEQVRMTGRLRYLYLRWVQRPVYLVALRRCRAFVAPSKFMAGIANDEVAVDSIVQIYNGVDLPPSSPPPALGPIVFVGRLEAVKGVDVLLAALAEVAQTRPGVQAVIVGDGRERQGLMELADSLGIASTVEFPGSLGQSDVRRLMRKSVAVVIPSLWPENLPTVALEAIGTGRAIIGSRVGGIPELVDHGLTGLLCEPGDVTGLACSIESLLADPAKAESFGRAAAGRRDNYACDVFVERITTLYGEVAAPCAP